MSRRIDIRNSVDENPITEIRFADEYRAGTAFRQADIMCQDSSSTAVRILESGNNDYVRVWDKAHAQNMITALEKAIELGWLK